LGSGSERVDLDAILAPIAHWASVSDQATPVVEPDHPAKKTDEKTANKPTDKATSESAVDLDSAEPAPPPTDSKGCTPDGGFPVTSITDNPNYQKLIRCIAGACVPEDSSVSFDAPSTAKRSVALGVLSGVPKVNELGELSKTLKDVGKLGNGLVGKLPIGALVGGVTALLWPDPTPDALFNQMKDYVDKVVPQAITDEHITDLKGNVEGLKTSLDAYLDAKNPQYKGILLGSLEQNLNTIEPNFFDSRASRRWRTLWLSAYSSWRYCAKSTCMPRSIMATTPIMTYLRAS
jgi:hypothetical protein